MLRDFVARGGEFSADTGDAFVRNTLALRLKGEIALPDGEVVIEGMDHLMARVGR